MTTHYSKVLSSGQKVEIEELEELEELEETPLNFSMGLKYYSRTLSLVLLVIGLIFVLLGFEGNSQRNHLRLIVGFICTLNALVLYGIDQITNAINELQKQGS